MDRQFGDRDAQPLESQLNSMLQAIYRSIVNAWIAERSRVEWELRVQEEQHLRREEARISVDRAQTAVDERARRGRLRVEANHWAQSRRIRESVAHLEPVGHEQQTPDEAIGHWMNGIASPPSVVYEAHGENKASADCYRKVIEFVRAHPDQYEPGFAVTFEQMIDELYPPTA